MTVTVEEMKKIEEESGFTTSELIEKVGDALSKHISPLLTKRDKILFLIGKGNNGADGIALYYQISNTYACKVYFIDSKTNSKYDIPKNAIIKEKDISSAIKNSTVIIDAIYGFGFRLPLSDKVRALCREVNESNAKVYSIDMNSGAEADSCIYDVGTIHSTVTFVIEQKKRIHAMNKENHLSEKIEIVPIGISEEKEDMNLETFFKNYSLREEDSHKGSFGKTLLIGGSYGMAGALGFNILGAKSMGSAYIEVGIHDLIYPILANRFLYPVYLPYNENNYREILSDHIENAKAIAFGSGCTNLAKKDKILDLIIEKAKCPIVLDAEGVHLLENNTFILNYAKKPVILTPHIKEFSYLIHKPISEIQANKVEYAVSFAKENQVFLVLKGANTVIASPEGKVTINESGNASLATAGSGDLLTGILTSLLTRQEDIYTALCMGVYMHGYIADMMLQEHSIEHFDFDRFLEYADKLFHENGF